MIAAHEVMLPFVLAVVIAYVLTPLVACAEKRKLPRPLAILLVYAVVLGSHRPGFVRGVAPRIALEFRTLRGELPALADEAKTKWVPAITDRMRALGLGPPAAVRRAAAGGARRRAPSSRGRSRTARSPSTWAPACVVTETKNGWLVEPAHEKKGEPFDPNRVIAEAVGQELRVRAGELARDRPRRARPLRGREPRHLRLLHHADARGVH